MNKRFCWGFFIYIILQGCQNATNNTLSEKDSIATTTIESHNQLGESRQIKAFWNNFNFSDAANVTRPEIGEQAFVNFIHLFPHENNSSIAEGIDSLISKSSSNKEVQSYFEELLRRYLYNVNSPFYNEPYYIIVLERLIASPQVSDDNKIKYKTLLHIAKRNQVGDKATDFNFYTDRNHTLHSIEAKYLIVFFYVPQCPSCEESIKILNNHPEFNAMLNSKIKMLALYADGNKEIWENYRKNIPSSWINAVDLQQEIIKQGLYDLKASPTIYLLDEKKRVLLKDTDLNELLNYLNRI